MSIKVVNTILTIVLLIALTKLSDTEATLRILLSKYPVEMIGARLYRKDLITDRFSSPAELAYDSATRNLFFMYMDDNIQNSGRAFINIANRKAVNIKGIEKNKATAVNEETGDIFFGSEKGLYKFDPFHNEARLIGLFGVNILKLVIKNNEMYIVNGDNHKLYKAYDFGSKLIKIADWDNVINFHVDSGNNIHFVSTNGVFCAIKGHEAIKNVDLNDIYHFMSDDDKVFGVSDDGLYEIDCRNGKAKFAAYLDFIPSSIIFGDYGDIYYSIANNIYRLKPVNSYHIYNFNRKNSSYDFN